MNRKNLFSLTTILFLGAISTVDAAPVGVGTIFFNSKEISSHTPGCEARKVPCVDQAWLASMWFDPGMIIATGLDWWATYDQKKKTINCEEALDELDKALGENATEDTESSFEDTTDTSLTTTDTVAVVPTVVTEVLNMKVKEKEDLFDSVRYEVENYVFYSDSCQDDCVLERQNTWLLTSVAMAAASGDKVLAATRPTAEGKDSLSDEFSDLVKDFNNQKTPMAMWGSSSKITLHTHVQQNDINALYARDLEMNALKGVRDSDDVRLIQDDSRY